MALAAAAAWVAARGTWAYGLGFFVVACASLPVQIPLELPACLRRWHAAFAAAPLRAACMVRLSPLPIAVKNLGLAAVPSVSGTDYMLSTISCTLPYTFAHVLFGARAGTLADALAAAERASGGAVAAGVAVAAVLAASMLTGPRGADKSAPSHDEGGKAVQTTATALPVQSVTQPAPAPAS